MIQIWKTTTCVIMALKTNTFLKKANKERQVPKMAMCFNKKQTKITDNFDKPKWPIYLIENKRTNKLVAEFVVSGMHP